MTVYRAFRNRYLEVLQAMTEERGPVEDDINDPKLQDQSPDLPAPVEGNEDEDDTEDAPVEAADTGAVEPEEE